MAVNPNPKLDPSLAPASSRPAGDKLQGEPRKQSFWNRRFLIPIAVLALGLAFNLATHLTAEVLWFEKLGYLSALLVRLRMQVGLWAIAFFTSAIFLWGNLGLTDRLKWHKIDRETPTPRSKLSPNLSSVRSKPARKTLQFSIALTILLPLIFALSTLVGIMLVHYTKVALEVWQPNYNLPSTTPSLPSPFNPIALVSALPRQVANVESLLSWSLASVVGTALLLLANSRWCLRVFAIAMSLIFGFVISGNWSRVLLFFNNISFARSDPIFNHDISFYLYKLPLWQLAYFWLGGLSLYAFAA
ncbi:MAG: UPF0182 family protein, partial [Cyanobacteriota bacterium]|nr:UPF0182 family protein [Cyanobacteriota bacterium]